MTTKRVVIVGGGPVGATLALTLQHHGVPVTMLEAREKGAAYQDQRALALSYGSRRILEKLGVDILFAPSKDEIYPKENKIVFVVHFDFMLLAPLCDGC